MNTEVIQDGDRTRVVLKIVPKWPSLVLKEPGD